MPSGPFLSKKDDFYGASSLTSFCKMLTCTCKSAFCELCRFKEVLCTFGFQKVISWCEENGSICSLTSFVKLLTCTCKYAFLFLSCKMTTQLWLRVQKNVALMWRLRDFADFVAVGPSLVPTSSKLRRWWVEFLASSEVARGAGVVTTTKDLSGNFG